MPTRQGNLKDYNGNKIAPNTLAAAVYDAARSQALSASLLALVEKGALGYPTFSTVTAYQVGAVVFYDRNLYRFTSNHAAGAWDAEDVEEYSVKDLLDDLADSIISALEDGSLIPALASTLEGWADDELSIEDVWSDIIRTTGGDTPILTENGGRLISIAAKSDFFASALKTTGYNLLRDAVAVGDGWYFPVPKLTFGTFGTAQENNGILFTDSDHENLKPTVYFKPLASGVPESATDGTACEYHDEQGYRFFVTDGPGYLIVSGITRSSTCAHVAWEDWYDKYVAIDDANDAGDEITLSTIIHALHSFDKMLAIGTDLHDIIEFGDSAATWKRNLDKVEVKAYDAASGKKWTDEEITNDQGETLYRHSVNISEMKSDGAARLANGAMLESAGTTVSYVDGNAHAAASDVVYELATPVTGTVSCDPSYILNDCGFEMFSGATGTATVVTMYAQNIPDALAEIARMKMRETVDKTEDNAQRIEDLETRVIELEGQDPDYKGGQPRLLLGHGAPAEVSVPDNWVQLADGGFNWIGKPAFIGQEYVNQDANSANHYIGVLHTDYTLKWLAI